VSPESHRRNVMSARNAGYAIALRAIGSNAMFDGTLRSRQQPQFLDALCQILVIELQHDLPRVLSS
jgi:hypothetical protein